MKTLTTLEQLQALWSPKLQATLGDNLLCAFAHGDCLMPGFDPRTAPWQISFWLRSNQPEHLAPLKPLVEDPAKSGVRFGFFLTPELFQNSQDVFPLEYTHMAHRHGVIHGAFPLETFRPSLTALRLELEREWRGLLIHMRREFLYALATPKRFEPFFTLSLQSAMPLLYGSAYLFTQKYPATHGQALESLEPKAPGIQKTFSEPILASQLTENTAISLANNYILALQTLVQSIDQLETLP